MQEDIHCGKTERGARVNPAGQGGIHVISFYSALTSVLGGTGGRREGRMFDCKRLCREGCCERIGRGGHVCCRLCRLSNARSVPLSCGRVSLMYVEPSKTCRTPTAIRATLEATEGQLSRLSSGFRFRALQRACAAGLLSGKTTPGSMRRLLKRSSMDAAVGICTRTGQRNGQGSTQLLSGIIKRWGQVEGAFPYECLVETGAERGSACEITERATGSRGVEGIRVLIVRVKVRKMKRVRVKKWINRRSFRESCSVFSEDSDCSYFSY